jgi:hypothetical protein
MEILLLALRLLAALALYAFLAAILAMLRRDLKAAPAPDGVVQRSARLVVLETGEQMIAAGTAFALRPVTSIGRGPANAISIADDYASTRHALVSLRGDQWWVEDLGSRNGTLLNSAAVEQPTVLAAGDIIVVGRTELRLECDDGSRTEG